MQALKSQLLFPNDREPAGRHRKPNWIAGRGGLIGPAWIDQFCAPDRADYNSRHRNVFFVTKRDGRFVATGKLII